MNNEETKVLKRKLEQQQQQQQQQQPFSPHRPLYWGAKLPKLNRNKSKASDSAPSSGSSSLSSTSSLPLVPRCIDHAEISPTTVPCPVIVTAVIPEQRAIPALCIGASKVAKPEPRWPLHRHPMNKEQFERWWDSLKQLRGERKESSYKSPQFIEDSETAAFGLQWLISALRPAVLRVVEIHSVHKLTPEECEKTEEPLAFLETTLTPTISLFYDWPSDDYIDANILKRFVTLPYPTSHQTTTRARLSSLLVSLLFCDIPVLPSPAVVSRKHFGFDFTTQWKQCMQLKCFFEATLAMCISYYGVMDICGLRAKSWHHSLPDDEETYDVSTRLILDLVDRLIPKRSFMVEDRLFLLKDMAFHDTNHLQTTEDLGQEFLNFNSELFETYLSTKYHIIHAKVARYLPFERCLIFMLERVRKVPATWTDLLSMVCNFIGVNLGSVIPKYEFNVLSKQQRSVHLKLAYCPGGDHEVQTNSSVK